MRDCNEGEALAQESPAFSSSVPFIIVPMHVGANQPPPLRVPVVLPAHYSWWSSQTLPLLGCELSPQVGSTP